MNIKLNKDFLTAYRNDFWKGFSIHELIYVGAGGLSNAMPELVHDGERGGKFDLRSILVFRLRFLLFYLAFTSIRVIFRLQNC